MAPTKPNIILLVIDACSYKHTSLADSTNGTTPFLRALASEATHYSHAYSHAPISGLAITALTTSSFAFDHQTMPVETGPTRPSLAVLLKQAGYFTGLISANPYYARKFGYSEGVDFYRMLSDESRGVTQLHKKGIVSSLFVALAKVPGYQTIKTLVQKNLKGLYEAGRIRKTILITNRKPFSDAGETNAEIFSFLKERPADTPFFLQVQYMDLHAPNLPPQQFLERLGKVIGPHEQTVYGRRRSMRPLPEFTVDEIKDLKLLYDGCLAHVDSRIEELCAKLKQTGIFDNTLIIVTGDHGEAFFEHNDLGHHSFLYEENIRVPLIIKYPHNAGVGTIDTLASHVDVGPTIFEVAGILRPETFIGTSLSPLKEGKETIRNHAISFIPERFTFEDVSNLDFSNFKIALHTKEWKLIVFSKGLEELYNLANDPDEKHNILDVDMPEDKRQIHADLRRTLEPYLVRIKSGTMA